MENLKAVVAAAGMSLADALKATCFLKSMGDFSKFNGIYAGYFGETPPARETVEVARLPRDVLVEVSLICGMKTIVDPLARSPVDGSAVYGPRVDGSTAPNVAFLSSGSIDGRLHYLSRYCLKGGYRPCGSSRGRISTGWSALC